ncbi:glutaminase A [Anaerosalibacter massiliensis]|uniref:Glutaminase n=1 Tax=Anaerosalibacter massiliensis TaxID=1347392 RepID=A0A9X2MK34_9FIRM|nr:glutaminase A [Anaerosalibacter massiliensis]MCR2045064.1 glutaminase A [Anaerosalibacter massiliensis]
MKKLLDELIEKNRHLTKKGKVADYIPALKKANSKDLGICIIDMKGNIYTSGEYKTKFTIQSISKTLSLMLAIMDNGVEKVFSKVGMEPTGDAFNSMYKLEMPDVYKPLNPMINAGAIVVTSLIKGESSEEKFERILNFFRKITCNNKLNLNEEVYLSEKETGNKNVAMAYLLKDMGILEGDVEEILDIYFKQCSIEVDCIDIANIGLFLANRGKILKTGEAITTDYIARIVKTLMVTCGMYDFSGEFAIRIGIPAKSGVSGGIMASVPHRMGIGIYGPSLDEKGNSVAGYEVLEDLSKKLNLSIF